MPVLDTAASHITRMIAEMEAMVGRHKDMLTQIEAEAAAEAKRIPTMQDLRDFISRIPV